MYHKIVIRQFELDCMVRNVHTAFLVIILAESYISNKINAVVW